MADEHTGRWATDCLAGPFQSKTDAEDMLPYCREGFDIHALLGEYNGLAEGYRQALLDAKAEVKPGSHVWHMLDTLVCEYDKRNRVFMAYVSGKFNIR